MADRPQTYSNHKRVFVFFQWFIFPALLANFFAQLGDLLRAPSFDSAWTATVAFALAGLAIAARHMVIVVQNRLIRLEERLRLTQILPEDLRARIPELRVGQLVALRFASDAEVPELTRRCLAGEFAKADEIKRAVKDWRPDTLRA